jgi:hypothetical protein
MFRFLSRRQFFAGALAAAPLLKTLNALSPGAAKQTRIQAALELRTQAAALQSKRPLASMTANGDESSIPGRIACFAKGLPHNRFGEVEPLAYEALLMAMKSGTLSDFERIPRAGGRKLSNPLAAFTFHLEGGDPHTFEVPAAPSIASQACSFDISEIYWQSVCRDVPFSDYSSSPLIREAAAHLGATPASIFRGPTKGDLAGPYVSQFLLKPVPYGSGRIEQRYKVPIAGNDFMTSFSEWSQMQLGFLPWRTQTDDAMPRYIRNGRDLAEYVHYDFAYQAYLAAALILINSNAKSILNCNQFKSGNNPYRYSTIEEGFVTFGPAEAADWLGRVTTAALKAAYYQKWMVHRRVRPEAIGGLIHQTRIGTRNYPLHSSALHSKAVDAVYERTGTYLLPQTYPEGCPLHPSYPSGHAAIAGACAVVLKACFDGSMVLPDCVEPSVDGLSLKPCLDHFPLVGDEIDKLAFNIAMGRDWAGIHYRSDSVAGLQLGEEVGISILQDMARTYTEEFKGFTFNRFNGRQIHITPSGEVSIEAP